MFRNRNKMIFCGSVLINLLFIIFLTSKIQLNNANIENNFDQINRLPKAIPIRQDITIITTEKVSSGDVNVVGVDVGDYEIAVSFDYYLFFIE